jgi:WD40 repeat protein
MSEEKPNLDSLFEAAVRIESAAELAAFVENSCGENHELRRQLEKLLHSDQHAGSFLARPVVGLDQTVLTPDKKDNLAESLEAGLASVFSVDAAVVVGHANHSILKALGNTIDEVPQVALRESKSEQADPITRPTSPELPATTSGSRYQLQGVIARGGMGAIIKGRDTDLGRDLAIKVLLNSHKNKPEVIQRFVEEAQIGGQLQHPGIAPVYELGQFADQRPFFSMKLVKGETLSKLLAERADTNEDRGKLLGIFEQICQTMAYAHSRGVIHRDLKPANIMVGAFGEVQVMDWGLAKVLPVGGVADEKKSLDKQQGHSIIQTMRSVGSDSPGAFGTIGSIGSHTQIGSVMGTPAYMPPEQALGQVDNMDERADVFALGAILCEILTGKPPYVGDNGTQVYRLASRAKLDDCFERLDRCGADDDLITLTKHCLELEPADRPRDACVLANRVTGYLESVETKLRETELQRATQEARADAEAAQAQAERQRVEHQQRSARRMRKMLIGLAGVTLVAAVALVGALVANNRANKLAIAAQSSSTEANRQREEANRQRDAAQRAKEEITVVANQAQADRDILSRRYYLMHVASGNNAIGDDNFVRAGIELDQCDPEQRGWEWYFLDRRARSGIQDSIPGTGRPLFTSDGERLVCTQNSRAVVWDIAAMAKLFELSHAHDVVQLALSPNDKLLVVGLAEGGLMLWDLDTQQKKWPAANSVDATGGLSFSPDGSLIAACSPNALQIVDASTGSVEYSIAVATSRNPSFSFDGGWILAEATPGVIVDVHTGTIAAQLPATAQHAVFSPKELLIASGNAREQAITLWDWNGNKLSKRRSWLGASSNRFFALRFHPKGHQVVSAQGTGTMVWDIETGKAVARYESEWSFEPAVSATRNVVALSLGGEIDFWRYMGIDDLTSVRPSEKVSQMVRFSPDGSKIAVGSHRGQQELSVGESPGPVMILDAKSGDQMGTISVPCRGFSWTPDSLQIAVSRADVNTHELYEVSSGELVCEFPGNFAFGKPFVDSTGNKLTSVFTNGQNMIAVRSWDIKTGRLSEPFVRGNYWGPGNVRRPVGGFTCAAIGPQGNRVAIGSGGGVVLWDTRSENNPLELNFKKRVAETLSFTHDGRHLFVTTGREGFRIVDLETQQAVREIVGPAGEVAISPDKKFIVSSGDGVVIWDIESGIPLITLSKHLEHISVDWSSNLDNPRIAAGRRDGTVDIWPLITESFLQANQALAEEHLGD